MIIIKIGATDNSIPDEGYYTKVSQIIIHEGWDRKTSANDIALYKTDRPIKYRIVEQTGQYIVNSICLPKKSYTEPNFAILAGWGQIGANSRQSNKLQKLQVPKFAWSQCRDNYEKLAIVDDNMLCYGGEGDKDSCYVSLAKLLAFGHF